MLSREHIEQLENEMKELIQQLKTKYEQLTQSVKKYEEMRRNCTDEFYLKSYQITIHRLNAKREIISEIIDKLKKYEQLKENDFNSLSKECFKLAKQVNWTKKDTRRVISEYREVEAKANKYDSLVENIKDKIAEEKDDMYFAKKEEQLRIHAHTREVLQELLDTEK